MLCVLSIEYGQKIECSTEKAIEVIINYIYCTFYSELMEFNELNYVCKLMFGWG